MERPELILVKGGKDRFPEKSSDFKEETIEDSIIKEERVFSKNEILGIIEQIAKKEGISSDNLEISGEKYDKDRNLIILYVKVKDTRAIYEGYKSIEYDYMIKGNHGKKSGFSSSSDITRVYNCNDSESFQAGIVAKYSDGKWELSPGKINPTVTMG